MAHATASSLRPDLSPAPWVMLSLWLFLCAVAAPVTALAASPATPSTQPGHTGEEARWFQVELILFSQQTDAALDAEQWPAIEGLTLPETLLELNLPLPEPPVEEQTESAIPDPSLSPITPPITAIDAPEPDMPVEEVPDLPPAFQILEDDKRQLNDMATRIQRSSRLNLLLHTAWQQPTYDREHAVPVYLVDGMTDPLPVEETETTEGAETAEVTATAAPSEGEPALPLIPEYATEEDALTGPRNPQFAGTVTLSVERYLHIATDLIYRRPVSQHMPIPISNLDLWYDRPYPTLQEPQGPAFQQVSWQAIRGFRLQESRRMRSTEIHYLDHPFMGMVVVITPVELPEPAEKVQQTSPQNFLSIPTKPRTLP